MDITQEALYKSIGLKIRAMRATKEWTQETLGNRLDVSAQYISRIERGAGHLSLRKLYAVADALECSIYALLPATQSKRSYSALNRSTPVGRAFIFTSGLKYTSVRRYN